MVEKVPKGDTILYVCGICEAAYPQEEWAEKCNEWCETHDSNPNPEITYNAVQLEREKKD
ncbi:hypothetical protein ACFLV6_04045 [Chloroflexota bacterium]